MNGRLSSRLFCFRWEFVGKRNETAAEPTDYIPEKKNKTTIRCIIYMYIKRENGSEAKRTSGRPVCLVDEARPRAAREAGLFSKLCKIIFVFVVVFLSLFRLVECLCGCGFTFQVWNGEFVDTEKARRHRA